MPSILLRVRHFLVAVNFGYPLRFAPNTDRAATIPPTHHHIHFLVPCGVPLSVYPIPFFGFFTCFPPLSCRRGDYTMASSSPLLEAPSTPPRTPSRERARKRGAYDPHHDQDGSPSQIGSQNLSVLWDSTSAPPEDSTSPLGGTSKGK